MRGITLYKNKIARAKSIAEKNTYTDSLMIVYDLRNEYFGDHPKYGTPYILDRKAREYLMYKPADRKGIREAQPSRPAATTPIPRPSWPISRTSATITEIPTR